MIAADVPCTFEIHAEFKKDPATYLTKPVDWPEAGFRLYQCPRCGSHLCIKYETLDALEASVG